MKNYRQCMLTILSCFLFFNGFSQNTISTQWLINSMGESWDIIADQIVDNEGMVYLTGNFASSFQMSNHSKELAGTNSMFVVKAAPDGSIVWMKKFAASGYCYSGAVAINKLGEVFVSGNYQGEMQASNLNLNSANRKQGFLIKLARNGEPEWGINLNGSFACTQMHLTTSPKGDVYFAGSFTGKLVVEEELFDSRYYSDIFVAGYDKRGKLVHSTILYGAGDDIVNAFTSTTGGELVLTGSFEKELVAGNNKLVSIGQKDILLVKMDENLRITSSQQFGGIYDDAGSEIAYDASGNMMLAGTFTGRLEFDKSNTLESLGTSDVFLSKFDSDAQCLWSTSFGSQGSDHVSGMGINTLNDCYLIGTFRGDIRIDDRTVSSESFANDVFLAKFDAMGQHRFIEQFGSENHDFGKTIGLDANNNLYISGNFSGQMKFLEDRSIQSENKDAFISRLHDCEAAPGIALPADTVHCGTDFIITVNADFETYYWNGIAGNNEFIADSSGQIILEAIDKLGCNSFDTMHLVLNKPPKNWFPDTIRVQQGEIHTLEAPAGMREYLWSDGSVLPFLEVDTSTLPTGSTSFWLQVIDENGCLAYDEVSLMLTTFKDFADVDIAEQKNDNDLGFEVRVFPNPADDNLHILLSESCINDYIQIVIYDQNGKVMYDNDFFSSSLEFKNEVDITSYPTGTYLISIVTSSNTYFKKVIIY